MCVCVDVCLPLAVSSSVFSTHLNAGCQLRSTHTIMHVRFIVCYMLFHIEVLRGGLGWTLWFLSYKEQCKMLHYILWARLCILMLRSEWRKHCGCQVKCLWSWTRLDIFVIYIPFLFISGFYGIISHKIVPAHIRASIVFYSLESHFRVIFVLFCLSGSKTKMWPCI